MRNSVYNVAHKRNTRVHKVEDGLSELSMGVSSGGYNIII